MDVSPQDSSSYLSLFLEDDLTAENKESSSRSRRGFWARFARNRAALFGVGVLALIVLLIVAAPLILHGYDPYNDHTDPLSLKFLLDPNLGPSTADFPLRLFGRTNSDFQGGINFRQSVLAEVLLGGRATLLIGLGSAAIATSLGTLLGSISGYYGGVIDAFLMRLADFFLSVPFMPLVVALIVAAQLGSMTPLTLVLLFGFAGWPTIARLVRANFLILREQSYIEAARATGVGGLRIILRHMLPNAVAPIAIAGTLSIANFILAEATLEYLQVVSLTGPMTWGAIIADAVQYLLQNLWWWTFFPGLFITLTVLSINFIGDGLRTALEVRDRVL